MQPLKVAYLVNQYPKVSHSFIRREILALERLGLTVERFAARGWDEVCVDPRDALELGRTKHLLRQGVAPLIGATLRHLLREPASAWRGLKMSLTLSKPSDRSVAHHLVYWAEACLLLEWCRSAAIHHLHAHFGTNPAELALICRAMGGPSYSFTVHGPEEFDKPEFLGLSTKIQHSAFVVAISSFGRSQLFRWISGQDWHKVKVVHCGLELEFRELPSLPPARQAARLVCIGRLCEQKGQLLLVRAAARLKQEGRDFSLVLAGDGEMRPQIEDEIQRLGLQDRIEITGWISSDRVKEELLRATAMVLPSFAEGLPVVIMEAMAMKCPVITTQIAGIPELVVHQESGWLCAAGDIDSLASAMAECLSMTPEGLAQMGASARARVLTRHDVDTEASKLHAHFEAACHAA